jgi:hypothetical protein
MYGSYGRHLARSFPEIGNFLFIPPYLHIDQVDDQPRQG